ncbi:MAG: hypothetical protein Q9171_005245 [Xanthocarpia ochracea]
MTWETDPTHGQGPALNGITTSEPAKANVPQAESPEPPGLWLTGIGTQYPPYLSTIDKFETYVKRFYDSDNQGIKKLLEISRNTGIETRSTIRSFESGLGSNRRTPSDVSEQDALFRKAGVDLTVQACRKALREWGGSFDEITHTVGVTCTNTGNPGYDLLVAQKLQLRHDLDRTLLHGVGCAGGLAALRAAAQLACGASLRRRPARILVHALRENELSAKDFDWALHPGGLSILEGAQRSMHLSKDQLRASYEIYRTHGNSSSPTVLRVLDKLRKMGDGRENIVAAAFGPGLAIEMAMLKRCRIPQAEV